MKRFYSILVVLLMASAAWSCGGDHANKHGEDTAAVHHPAPSSVDTSKNSGGASVVDDSGSGGTKVDSSLSKKDTSKK